MKRMTLGALAVPFAFCSVAFAEPAQQTMTRTTTVQTETAQTEYPEAQPAPQPVVVEQPAEPPVVVEDHRNPWLSTQFGLMVGGGVANYTSGGLDSATGTGGAWDARFILGAHSPIGIELGYVGTANSIDRGRIAGYADSATVLSNAFEGDVRLATPAFRKIPLQLYGFIGAGLARFDLMLSNDVATQLNKVDTTFVMPFGGGVQFNLSEHFVVDGRFTYRMMFDTGLLSRDSSTDMYTATAQLGYIF